jgi:radical SAM protein with 4Fe4S-binding SPASM domain
MTRVNPFDELYRQEPRAEFPLVVDIEATNFCNLKCKMCSRQIMDRETGKMSFETFKKIIDGCERYCGIRFIRWGEPFLNENLLEFVDYAKKKGIPVHITNNGQIISDEQIDKIVRLGLDSIIFSMQGATKDGYETMRVGASYDRLEKTVIKLNEARGLLPYPFIQITSTMTDEDDEQIKDFKKKWNKLADRVNVGKTHFSRLKKQAPKYEICNEVLKKLSVDWNGNITACCGDFNGYLTLGNINEITLQDAWNGEKLAAIRTMLRNGMHKSLTLCSTCHHAYEGI